MERRRAAFSRTTVRRARPLPGHRTEIRSRWTKDNLYFLFICPYEALHLKPNPTPDERDQPALGLGRGRGLHRHGFPAHPPATRNSRCRRRASGWTWISIATSPRPEGGWLWNSGFAVKARIDAAKKIWYGEMRIPVEEHRSAPAGSRASRCASISTAARAPDPHRKYIAWQPTHAETFHVPEAFGRMKLAE